ncbi:MAG: hypothetical protein ACFFB3_16135 [Candidatus Hodarchaeota archaeon]
MITAKAPTRIDLAGGTLDIYPLYLFLDGGLTVNIAIDLASETTVQLRDDEKIFLHSKDLEITKIFDSLRSLTVEHELEAAARVVKYFAPIGGINVTTSCQVPKGSGLGGSSALIVTLVAALAQHTFRWPFNGDSQILSLSRDIEAKILGIPVGTQDYKATIQGGANALWLDVGETKCEQISLSHNFKDLLETQIVLCYTGIPRFSGRSNWDIFRKFIDGDDRIRALLRKTSNIAKEILDAFREDDFESLVQSIQQEAQVREQLYGNINIDRVKMVQEICHSVGVTACKPCGAGGGGCYILLASSQHQAERLRKNLIDSGIHILPFNIDLEGLKIYS